MNKEEFVSALAKKLTTTKIDAAKSLDAMLECIQKNIKKEKEIKFIGFGTFKLKNRKARKIKNPQNGQEIDVPAQNYVSFSAGTKLKLAVKK